jgi:dihydroflavonol-4-reductase
MFYGRNQRRRSRQPRPIANLTLRVAWRRGTLFRMRILVTGGTGFIGSHITRALAAAGHQVRLLARSHHKVQRVFGPELGSRLEIAEGDMTDAEAVSRALADRQAIVHAAAVVALERKHAARVLAENRRGVETVVGSAVAAGVERMLYVSSAAAMFRPNGPPVGADTAVAESSNAYTRSKAECESYVRSLQARGAPIRTTYPAGVIGPDDPGLSEANRGLLAFFRGAAVVTDSGLQMIDVRDVAQAHLRLLDSEPAPGRHLLTGHFVPWAELVDLFSEITGKKLLRLPIPGAVLRAAGALADVVKHVYDFQFPLSSEAMQIMTQWTPVHVSSTEGDLGFTCRDPRVTLRDLLLWFHSRGMLPASRLGRLC